MSSVQRICRKKEKPRLKREGNLKLISGVSHLRIAELWTKNNKKPAVVAGFVYFFGLCWIRTWWR